MEEERKAKNSELDIEEVNVYTDDCGVIKYECLHDCMGSNAMISPWELIINDEQGGDIIMIEANLEKQELQKEEVNVYDVNCNQVRYECVTDCIMATCFFSCDQ